MTWGSVKLVVISLMNIQSQVVGIGMMYIMECRYREVKNVKKEASTPH